MFAVVHIVPLAEEVGAVLQLILGTQPQCKVIRIVGIGGEFEFLARVGIHADPRCTRDNPRTCAEGCAALADLRVELVASADVVHAKRRVHALFFADIKVEIRTPVIRLAAVHRIYFRRNLDVLQPPHEPARLVCHRTCIVDECARVLLCLLVPRDRLDALGDVQDALGGGGDVFKRLSEILRCLRVGADGLKIRHDALDARRGLCKIRRHRIHICEHSVQVAAILVRHLLQGRCQTVEVGGHLLHVDNELHHRALEAGGTDNVVDGGEHCLDLNNHLVQLCKHGIHAHLVLAVEIIPIRVKIDIGRGCDDDEFIPHDARLPNGDGRAARNLHAVPNSHGDSDPQPIAHDLLDLSNGNTREEHLRLGVQPDGAAKSRVEHIVLTAAKAQSAKEHDDGDEECRPSECKCSDLCLCAHAPTSLRWCSVRKNACTRSSLIS